MTRLLLAPLLLLVLALGTACGDADDQPAQNEPNPSESDSERPSAPPPTTPAPSEEADESDGTGDTGVDGEDGDDPDDPDGSDGQPGDEDGSDGDDADDAAVIASMQTSLDALVDPKTTPQQKAARIVGGRDLAPLFQQFARGGGGSDITFTVEDPDVEGRRATADVGALRAGQTLAQPAETPFVLAEGEWRLERQTVCYFATTVDLTCP